MRVLGKLYTDNNGKSWTWQSMVEHLLTYEREPLTINRDEQISSLKPRVRQVMPKPPKCSSCQGFGMVATFGQAGLKESVVRCHCQRKNISQNP